MSETNNEVVSETVEAVVNTEATTENTEVTSTDNENAAEQATDIDWKKEARKWEARAKSAKEDKELADKYREYIDSQKSETEKLTDKLAQYEAKEREANAKLLRLEIASDKGISPEVLAHLKGETREELEAAVDVLLNSLAAESVKPKTKPNPEQGKSTDSAAGQIASREQLASMSPEDISKALKDGRLDHLLGKSK
jgi:hypothetical protein